MLTLAGVWVVASDDEVERTLNIMVAAPDLLAACRWALEHAEWSSAEDGTDPIRAAIARAEGRSE